MNEERDELIELLKPLREETWRQGDHLAGEHPAPEELAAYHSGQRSPAEESRIQEHLVLCHPCTRLLLDLAAFPELDDADSRLTDEDVTARWTHMQERLRADGTEEAARPKLLGMRRLAAPRFFLPYALAASLLIAAVTLALWAVSLRRENERLAAQLREKDETAANFNRELAARKRNGNEAAQSLAAARREVEDAQREMERQRQQSARLAGEQRTETAVTRRPPAIRAPSTTASREEVAVNVPVFELYPEETLRGAGEEVKTITASRDARRLTLTLNSASRAASDSYRLEVVNADGKTVWAGKGLRKSAAGNFTVALPARLLPAGQYRFRLYDVRAGAGAEQLEEYAARIQYR